MPIWTMEDGTTDRKGYIRLLCDGEHAADVFPFGHGRDAERIRNRAYRMLDILQRHDGNAADSKG